MKNFLYTIAGVAIMAGTMLSSCTKDFQDLNTDPNSTPNALPEQLLAPSLVNSLALNQLRNRNFNNELMQVTVDLGDGEGKVFRYDYRSGTSDNLYNGWYSQLTNFKDMYTGASEQLTKNTSYQGISLICQSWLYSLLTDTYGDVPYFESNKAKAENGGITEPVFDRQATIYEDIFKQLEAANTLLVANAGIEINSDPVFGGSIIRWRKFGNSLYLRLLLRVSAKSEMTAFCTAKIKEILETNSTNYPIIASNDESAILKWSGVAPYTSPLMSVREQDFRAPSMASFFIDRLVAWRDPRIDGAAYGTNTVNRWRIAPYQGAYVGIPSGYTPGTVPEKRSYFYSTGQTVNNAAAATLMNEPLTGQIMNYAEVQFIKAEAALRGWISTGPATYYTDGALQSIKLWIPAYAENINTWLAGADITWDETESFDEKMERIHALKYYALFLVDLQQWYEYRRTGHPVLPKGAGLKNNGVMPARMVYPVYVQSTNPTNYQAAVAIQGPDVISTQVWWQKP